MARQCSMACGFSSYCRERLGQGEATRVSTGSSYGRFCQRGPQGFASWCPVDEAPNMSKPEPGATDVVDLRQKAT